MENVRIIETENHQNNYIENIVNDLKTMPKSHLKTMSIMVHVFKKNANNELISDDFMENWANSFFVGHQKDTDAWSTLSNEEKDDINAGIHDLENGRYKNIEQVLSKYK